MASLLSLIFATLFGLLLMGSLFLIPMFPMFGMISAYLTARVTWNFTAIFFQAAAAEKILG